MPITFETKELEHHYQSSRHEYVQQDVHAVHTAAATTHVTTSDRGGSFLRSYKGDPVNYVKVSTSNIKESAAHEMHHAAQWAHIQAREDIVDPYHISAMPATRVVQEYSAHATGYAVSEDRPISHDDLRRAANRTALYELKALAGEPGMTEYRHEGPPLTALRVFRRPEHQYSMGRLMSGGEDPIARRDAIVKSWDERTP